MRALTMVPAFAFAITLIASFSASSAFATDDTRAAEREKKEIEMKIAFGEIGGMKKIVQHVANSNLACATGADCIALPMGSRACGGPTSFVVTSAENPSLEALTQSIDVVTQAERDLNKKFGMMSICSVEMPPALGCSNNLCEAF